MEINKEIKRRSCMKFSFSHCAITIYSTTILKLFDINNSGSSPIIISSVAKPCIVLMLSCRCNIIKAIIRAACAALVQFIMTSVTKQKSCFQPQAGWVIFSYTPCWVLQGPVTGEHLEPIWPLVPYTTPMYGWCQWVPAADQWKINALKLYSM